MRKKPESTRFGTLWISVSALAGYYKNMDMEQMLSTISSGMLLKQVLVIVFLCVLGYFFIWAVGSRLEKGMRALLSFPAGLSFFCTGIFSMLVIKIRISIPRLVFVLTFAFALVCLFSYFYRTKTGKGEKPDLKGFDIKIFLILIAVAAGTAFLCCAGILSVSLDNDSYYYYSTYPQILIKEGDLKYEFDILLTDSGIMTAIINSIPYLFGFLNTFGIQHFLNINFLLIFAAALFSELVSNKELLLKSEDPGQNRNRGEGSDPSVRSTGILRENKKAAIISFAVTVFLATSPAYITTAKLVMAGDYFMVFFFLLMYFGYREASGGQDIPFVLMLLTVMTGMLRQEGPVLTAFLILCLAVLEYENIKLVLVYVIPLMAAAGYYYLRVFVFLKVEPLYAFLTPKKALMIMAGLGLFMAYLIIIRGRMFKKLQDNMNYVILFILIAVNLLMLIKDHSRYLYNIYAFFMNIRLRNGWGYFGYFFFVFLVLAIIIAVKNRDRTLGFFDMMMIGYILASVCAAWGRGDPLRIGTGDSGNRVMLTAVPLITFAMTLRLFKKPVSVQDRNL